MYMLGETFFICWITLIIGISKKKKNKYFEILLVFPLGKMAVLGSVNSTKIMLNSVHVDRLFTFVAIADLKKNHLV